MASAEIKRPLLATRVYGPRFQPERVHPLLVPFFDHASPYGIPMVIVHPHSPAQDEVRRVSEGRDVHVLFSNGKAPEAISPADMINTGMQRARENGHSYFGIISSELAQNIPRIVPEMQRRLDADPELATVGVAINTVHDFDLLEQVRTFGLHVLTTANYATGFVNNAFSLHRARPQEVNGHTPEDFLFPELFESELGFTCINKDFVPLRYNEEIARMLLSIRNGRPLKMLLLAGSYTIDRDPNLGVSSSSHKVERRQATADSYRRHPDFAVSDETLLAYLTNHYQIDFGLIA